MSSDEHPRIDKGKRRATTPELTERAPLLGGSSSDVPDDEQQVRPRPQSRLRPKLCAVFLASLLVSIVVFLLLLAYSYGAEAAKLTPEDVIDRGLHVEGPDRVDVLNITADNGVWVQVDGRVGLDAGSIMGVNPDKANDGFWKGTWKSLGRWGVKSLREVTVSSVTVEIVSVHDDSTILATVEAPPLDFSLSVDPPSGTSWLTSISIPILIHPTQDASALIKFARDSWRVGFVEVRAVVGRVEVQGGNLHDNSWRRNFRLERSGVRMHLRKKVPTIPGFPPPGHNNPFPSASDLVTLNSFNISSQNDSLSLHAIATTPNPAPPNVELSFPQIPFVISLIATDNDSVKSIPVAFAYTQPSKLASPNITIDIVGSVVPLPSGVPATLSAFLTRYLSGQPNPILVETSLFPGFSIDTIFPGPDPKPQILRDVTIKDMKIKPSGTGNTVLASGTIFARAVLPKGIEVDLDVNRIWPDALVYDGAVPESADTVPNPPLPDPLPERAFAHVRPDDWLPAVSVREERGEEGSVFVVSAEIVDVPLEVLPGRESEFSRFVSKVIFGGGALAGVQGVAAVAVNVHGLPLTNGSGSDNEIELSGLPFRGSVIIRTRGVFSEHV